MNYRAAALALLLAPAAGLAADPAPPAPPAPPAAEAATSTPSTAPPPGTGTAAAAAPPTAPPTGTAAAPAKPPEPEYSSYAVLKGGWFGSAGDYEGDAFTGSGTWEVAVGTGRVFGIELASGSMTTESGSLKVKTIPILLSLRLQFPVSVVAPFFEVGAGAYFNELTVGGATLDDVTAGWHAGLGCDVLLGRLLLGVQARYMGIAPTFSTVGELTLDRYELLLRGGVRF